MQRLSEALRESPVDYKAPLTGSYTVLLTVGDMYATDDLGLIQLLWRPNLSTNYDLSFADMVRCSSM